MPVYVGNQPVQRHKAAVPSGDAAYMEAFPNRQMLFAKKCHVVIAGIDGQIAWNNRRCPQPRATLIPPAGKKRWKISVPVASDEMAALEMALSDIGPGGERQAFVQNAKLSAARNALHPDHINPLPRRQCRGMTKP